MTKFVENDRRSSLRIHDLLIVLGLILGLLIEASSVAAQVSGSGVEIIEQDPKVVSAALDAQWAPLLNEAGKVKHQLKLMAHLSTNSVTVGDSFELRLLLKNISEFPTSVDRQSAGSPLFLVRDQNGKPAKLTSMGLRHFDDLSSLFGSVISEYLCPGDARMEEYPLSAEYVFDRPGKYTVLVMWGNRRGGGLVAEPLEITLKDKNAIETKKNADASSVEKTTQPASPVPAGDKEWNSMMKIAGRQVNGCKLEAVISPYSPDAVHLVTTLVCVKRRSSFGNDGEDTVTRGGLPSDYRVLIRDSCGNAVPMTKFGQDLFHRRIEEDSRVLTVGLGIGTWFPLDEMFVLNSGQEYTILVVLPDQARSMADVVSAPLTIRVPSLSIAGHNRPLFGSIEIWPKLIARSASRDSTVAIDCNLERFLIGSCGCNEYPRITLRNRSGRVFGREVAAADTTVLIRDSRGEPLFPIDDEGQDGETSKANAWPFTAVGGEVITPKRNGIWGRLSWLNERPEKASNVFDSRIDFPDRFPVIRGEPYTILAAVRIGGKKPTFVVAKPLTYVASSELGIGNALHGSEASGLPTSPDAKSDHLPATRFEWDVLQRFAGKPFGNLRLTASEEKAGEFKIALINQGKRSILVKKWEGNAGYDLRVRTVDGKAAPLTEKGKALFQGGASLDIRDLKPREKIEATLSIKDLFEMKTPGDYTVLASLPVIGDMDAVLTAAPVKVHIDGAPLEPSK